MYLGNCEVFRFYFHGSCSGQVLHSAVTGHSSSSLSRVSKSLADFMQDTDFTNIWDSSVPDRRPANGVAVDQAAEAVKTPLMSVPKTETDIVKLAARTVRLLLPSDHHLNYFLFKQQ